MRRTALLTIAVLGGVVSLLGGTVLYAALQDTARTGTNSAESAALGSSADVQLATATRSGTTITCGTFSDDLATGLFTATGVSPGYESALEYLCVKNVGSQQVSLTASVDELTDVDVSCTGDEAQDDTTCGLDQAGELSNVLSVGFGAQPCANAGQHVASITSLKFRATTPDALGTLAANATACFSIRLQYPSSTAAAAVQTAQSDRATWRFTFSAQA